MNASKPWFKIAGFALVSVLGGAAAAACSSSGNPSPSNMVDAGPDVMTPVDSGSDSAPPVDGSMSVNDGGAADAGNDTGTTPSDAGGGGDGACDAAPGLHSCASVLTTCIPFDNSVVPDATPL